MNAPETPQDQERKVRSSWERHARKHLRKLSDQRLLMRWIWEKQAYVGEPPFSPFEILILEEMYRRSH